MQGMHLGAASGAVIPPESAALGSPRRSKLEEGPSSEQHMDRHLNIMPPPLMPATLAT